MKKPHLLRCSLVRLCDAISIASPRSLACASHLRLFDRTVCFSILFFGALLFLSPTVFAQETIVRVLVAENQKMLKVNIRSDYEILALPSRQLVKKGKNLSEAWFVPTEKGFRLGREEWVCQGLLIQPLRDRDLVLGASVFRGNISFFKDQNKNIYAINTLDIEKYLYGVLHHEVAAWWPMEALKAQAVAARTYALYQTLVSQKAPYDVKSSTSSQVYGGSTTERYRTKRAVDLTQGQVLLYQGKVFPAYFHATCAGLSAAAKELWQIDLPPLAGRVRCDYCRLSPHFNWEARVSLADIEEKLKQYRRPIGQVIKVEIISQTPSHRVGSLKFTGTAGEAIIAAKDFRIWIGGNKMRSTLFTIEIRDDQVYFHGRGWGHGVGLCQWGTLGQALLGKTHQAILKLYYPQAEIAATPAKN